MLTENVIRLRQIARMIHPAPDDVTRVIEGYAPDTRKGVLTLRDLILDLADEPLTEALRWGQPSYIARRGTPLRLGPHREASFAIFAHCQSNVINTYASQFPGWDRIDGNRAVLFDHVDQIEPERLATLIRHALTYRRRG